MADPGKASVVVWALVVVPAQGKGVNWSLGRKLRGRYRRGGLGSLLDVRGASLVWLESEKVAQMRVELKACSVSAFQASLVVHWIRAGIWTRC